MTGPEHYLEAEKLTTLAAESSRERPDWAAEYLQAAQVHATLALTAATAIDRLPGANLPVWEAWRKVAAPDGGESGA